MTTDNPFPTLSPAMARERFLVRDESWDERFRPGFNQFIIATFEFARPVIKLPVPPARTGNHALFLLTGGSVQMTVGHSAFTLAGRDVVVVPAGQIFTLIAIDEDTTGFMCFFSDELLRSTHPDADVAFLKPTGQPHVALSAAQTSFLLPLFGRLSIEYAESGASRTDLIGPYLRTVLAELGRAYAGSVPAKTDAGDRLVSRFTELIAKQVGQTRFVSEYANQLNVSPNHLNKVVKARTGRSPSVWIDERLVLEAKVWLFQSDRTVAQIAAELGFDDQSNFGKLFRKYAGVSPAAFRKMIDSDQSLPNPA